MRVAAALLPLGNCVAARETLAVRGTVAMGAKPVRDAGSKCGAVAVCIGKLR